MNKTLSIGLIIFAIIWIVTLIVAVRKQKIYVRYSMIWFFSALILLIVGIFPGIIEWINGFIGFEVIANLIIAILITLLMIITFVLTLVVTKQRKQMDQVIQELALLRQKSSAKRKK